MAFYFSSPLHHLCKSSFHFNFHSPKKPLFSPLLAVSSSHIETKLFHGSNESKRVVKKIGKYDSRSSKNEFFVDKMNNETRKFKGESLVKKMNNEVSHNETKIFDTNGKYSNGLCLSSDENKRVMKKNGKNEFRSSRDEVFVKKMNNIETKIFHGTNEKSSSGLCLSSDENKRVVKKSEKDGSRSSKSEFFVKKMNNEVSHNESYRTNENSTSGLRSDESKRVLKIIEESGFRKKRENGYRDSNRSSKGEIFVKKLNNLSHNESKVFSSNPTNNEKSPSGFSLSSDENKRVVKKIEENGSKRRRELGSEVSHRSSKGEMFVKKMKKGVDKEKTEKDEKKSSTEIMVRADLDMCSKRGDVMGALTLYDKVQTEGIKLGQYHYSVFLYLCSSAAIGVVSPAKSGNGGRSLSSGEVPTLTSIGSNEIEEVCNGDSGNMELNNQLSKNGKFMVNGQVINGEIRMNDDFRKYALNRGFEIYERMRLENVPMNEASLTSIARMALAMGDGDMAFDTVKQMKELGINPRLRSYGPALSAFCNSGNIDKAFLVEEHMLEHGVCPGEPELEALLRVSVEASRSDKVYYLLHKLRTSVRQVSASTADLLEKWFKSNAASKVGKRKWDERSIRNAIEKGGGGWHGEGWLGKGKWNVSRTSVKDDGICKCCGEKLATIDLDPVETEKFAESVASIAAKREKSSFQKFQKWVDYYGPFEAVVDAANIGLLTQRKFQPSKVNAVVNGIRHMLPSKKWPLIVLHNRRVTDDNMDKPMNKAIVEKWKNADALYATPTGSNDDWYWLYAAIKCKCLLVTNDEMRDHLFQLLGNDFFPRWKERHQVHFSFSETGPIFHMPPPCSVVIQESEKGHWHIPLASEHEFTEERQWLCVTRNQSEGRLNSGTLHGGN